MDLHPDNLRYILGLKLRTYRQQRGYGLKELHQRTGLSVSYLSEIEKGRKYPKPDKLVELAKALEVPYDDLVSVKVGAELGSVAALFSSSFLQDFPLAHFGLEPEDVLALVSNSPDQADALVRTIVEVARAYDVRVEHVQFAALRAYQCLHKNYFEEIEQAAEQLLAEQGWQDKLTLSAAQLRRLLAREGIEIDHQRLDDYPQLQGMRSVWVEGEKPLLLINRRLKPSQQAFLMGRELGYRRLGLVERSTCSTQLSVASLEQVINDFRAAYFAGALLVNRRQLQADLRLFLRLPEWSSAQFLALMGRYQATPETLFYRLSQLLPGLFGLGEIFFVRFHREADSERVELTKILNMSQVPVPHGVGLDEHYCRRWPGLRTLGAAVAEVVGEDGLRIDVQRSSFLRDGSEFFVVSVSRQLSLAPDRHSSVSLGFRINADFKRRVRWWNDPAVPRVEVDLTCQRCRLIGDACEERAAAPTIYLENQRQQAAEEQLAALQLEAQRR